VLSLLAMACVASSAVAQRVDLEPAITTRLTASDNAGLGTVRGDRDLVLDVTPRLRVRAEGPRTSLVGNVALESINYQQHTQDNEIFPRADLTGRVMAIERFFYTEGSVRIEQSNIDPFGARPTSTTTDNAATTRQYRLTPYIDTDPMAGLHLRVRSENVRTKVSGLGGSTSLDEAGSSYFGLHTASLEFDPRPLGWRLEAESSRTRYDGGIQPLSIDIARALVNLAVFDSATVGLRVGAERNNFLLDNDTRAVYGAQASWRPSERTVFEVDGEHRFFGTAMHLVFTHRMPSVAWNIRAARDIDTSPRSLFNLGPTDNVAALLDSMLTTRFPNAFDRARQVQDIISRQGLPSAIATAIPILAPRISIADTASIGATLLGTRSTVALSLYVARVRDALEVGPLATDAAATNNIQHGIALAYTLRVTPIASLGVALDYGLIESLDSAVAFERTRQASARGQLVVQLAPKTYSQFGIEYRKLASNVTTSGREASAYVSLEHRF